MSLDAFEFCFLTVQEKQVMTPTLFELEIYQKTENSGFFEKILYVNELKVKKVSLISKILCSSKDIFKNNKITGFYIHTDISRTEMIFEAKISSHEVTKSINSQTNNKFSMA